MRRDLYILPAMIIGTMAILMLVNYYHLEKEFRQEYKEMTASFSALQQGQERVTYGVLQSALFAYYDQDTIATDRSALKSQVILLQKNSIFDNELYTPLKKTLDSLEKKVDGYIVLVEDYLIINAGIKNSYVFISTYESKAHEVFPLDSQEVQTIHTMVDGIMQAKRMLDNSYMQDFSKSIELLRAGQYTQQQQEFIKMFITHADFMNSNYQDYIDTFSTIIESDLRIHLKSIKEEFLRLSQKDLIFINRLALLLFIIIFLALATIIALLFNVQKENRNLLLTKKQLRYALRHDSLTGLYNRNCYEEDLITLRRPSILLLNIGGFKLINDFYGSQRGDDILRRVAALLHDYMQERATKCYRIGGDEFAILFDNTPKSEIEQVANDLDPLITNTSYEMHDLELTIDINMATSETLPLLETADMALKQLKSQPTGHLIDYTPTFNVEQQIQQNIEMTQIIRDALKHDRVYPYYQPIIDLETREIVKYEALVRLELEDGNILTPYHFLSIAQQTALYREISRTVINKSLHYFADKPFRFAINLSMRDLEDDDIINTLLGQLSVIPEVAARMDIELLESHDLSDIVKVKEFIAKIRSFGCKISIDDFGSGYANFSYLAELDVDTVKIDGSLIKEITTNKQHLETVKAIMKLVNSLGIESVAEFVQDEDSAQLLQSLGVTCAQGFYFGKPDATVVEL